MATASEVIETEADVTRGWKQDLTPLGFSSRQVQVVFIDENGWRIPTKLTSENNSELPPAVVVAEFMEAIARTYYRETPRGTVSLLWARPGIGPLRRSDQIWVRTLMVNLRHHRIPAWPIHFANDAYLRILGADDLA